jgi:hypothetical protein
MADTRKDESLLSLLRSSSSVLQSEASLPDDLYFALSSYLNEGDKRELTEVKRRITKLQVEQSKADAERIYACYNAGGELSEDPLSDKVVDEIMKVSRYHPYPLACGNA